MPQQLPLFPEPFRLEASPDVIEICRECQGQIIYQHWEPDGSGTSEYQDRLGGCFKCAHPKRRTPKAHQ